jgi:hypothetical protein
MNKQLKSPSSNTITEGRATFRLSTAEKDQAVARLQSAFGDGRLDEKDFEDRMEKMLISKTHGELDLLFSDLPDLLPPKNLYSYHLEEIRSHATAIFSGFEQKGHFILPGVYHVEAICGGCSLDLREAQLESQNSTINITAVLGGVKLIIPAGVRVSVQGSPILGGISQKLNREILPSDAPQITIYAQAILSGIEILQSASIKKVGSQ